MRGNGSFDDLVDDPFLGMPRLRDAQDLPLIDDRAGASGKTAGASSVLVRVGYGQPAGRRFTSAQVALNQQFAAVLTDDIQVLGTIIARV